MNESEKARDAAMARVEAGSDPDWVRKAELAVVYLSRKLEELSSDDVWFHLTEHGVALPRERRALGPVMKRAVRDGVITPIGYAQSRRRERHAAPVTMYRKMS